MEEGETERGGEREGERQRDSEREERERQREIQRPQRNTPLIPVFTSHSQTQCAANLSSAGDIFWSPTPYRRKEKEVFSRFGARKQT